MRAHRMRVPEKRNYKNKRFSRVVLSYSALREGLLMARTRPRAARVHYEESSDECVKGDARFMNDIIKYI